MSLERRITRLTCISIEHRTFLLCFFFLLSISTVSATEYTIRPSLSNQSGASVAGEEVHEIEVKPIPYWMFLLMLGFTQLTSAPETFFPVRLLPILGGYKSISSSNVLENIYRKRLYDFIKSRPGCYFSEIIKATGLNRGTLEYHLRIMETKKVIVSHRTNRRRHYFPNLFAYRKEEQTVITALKNDVYRRIILEILNSNSQSITHKTLVERIGLSGSTITHHIKHLKEQGIVKVDTNSRHTTYSINSNYLDSLQKFLR